MPIDLNQPSPLFDGLVFLRLVDLYHQACEEGLDIPPAAFVHAALCAVLDSSKLPGGTLTICATPQATLILRWFDTAGAQVAAKEVGK